MFGGVVDGIEVSCLFPHLKHVQFLIWTRIHFQTSTLAPLLGMVLLVGIGPVSVSLRFYCMYLAFRSIQHSVFSYNCRYRTLSKCVFNLYIEVVPLLSRSGFISPGKDPTEVPLQLQFS